MEETNDPLNQLRIDRSKSHSRGAGRTTLWLLSLVLLLLAAAGGWWWLRGQRTTEVGTALVRLSTTSEASQATAVLDASGYVVPRRRATVSSKITGKIVEVMVEEGLEVRQGQILARLDDATPRRRLALAQAQLESARSQLDETAVRIAEGRLDLERQVSLTRSAVGSQADLDRAQASLDALEARHRTGQIEVKVAQRQIELRRQDLEDTIIRAPFDGIAVTKNAQPGEMISPVSAGGGFTRTGIGTLVDMTSLEIEVDVNETYINRVQTGQRITAVLDAYPGWQIPASVITIVPTADRQRATVRVRIGFDQLDPRILPDMGVKVSFLDSAPPVTADQPRKRLLMPAAALIADSENDEVWVVEAGHVRRQSIDVGPRSGDTIEIRGGLSEGQKVVISGGEALADGDEVSDS